MPLEGDAEVSAREELFKGLIEHACCFDDEEANKLIDAFAHELAEKIRAAAPPTAITSGGPYTNGVAWAANLIDPAAKGAT